MINWSWVLTAMIAGTLTVLLACLAVVCAGVVVAVLFEHWDREERERRLGKTTRAFDPPPGRAS
jgi:uncharacterized membrane protein